LTIGLLDAESGQRGYLLTGDRAFLQQYRAGLKSIAIYAPVYEGILVDGESKAISAEVMQLLEFKRAEMRSTINAYDRKDEPAAISMVASRVGHAYTERIYSDMHRIRTLEAQRVAPFQFWKPPQEGDIQDADRTLSPSALRLKMQAGY
jgi:CHASE3 domain sensor protein